MWINHSRNPIYWYLEQFLTANEFLFMLHSQNGCNCCWHYLYQVQIGEPDNPLFTSPISYCVAKTFAPWQKMCSARLTLMDLIGFGSVFVRYIRKSDWSEMEKLILKIALKHRPWHLSLFYTIAGLRCKDRISEPQLVTQFIGSLNCELKWKGISQWTAYFCPL